MRRTYRERRRALTPCERRNADLAAQKHVIGHPRFRNAQRIGLYQAFDGETDTTLIAEAASAAGKLVLYARMEAENALAFVEPSKWSPTRWGISQPEGRIHSLSPQDILMVPGIVFDRRGHRLGFGKGFYDRALSRERVWSLGLCYECQVVDTIPEEDWDRPVSALATEVGLTELPRPEKVPK